jgi:hypothetical protein
MEIMAILEYLRALLHDNDGDDDNDDNNDANKKNNKFNKLE